MSFKYYIILSEYASIDELIDYLTKTYTHYTHTIKEICHTCHTLIFKIDRGILKIYINKDISSVYLKSIDLSPTIVNDISNQFFTSNKHADEFYKAKLNVTLKCNYIRSTFLDKYNFKIGSQYNNSSKRDFYSAGNVVRDRWTFGFDTNKKIEWSKETNRFFDHETKTSFREFLMIVRKYNEFYLPRDIVFLIISEIAKKSQPLRTEQKVIVKKNKLTVTGNSINPVLSNIILDYVIKNCIDK
jgi:hypothetical protein